MINHLEREYIFACIAYEKSLTEVPCGTKFKDALSMFRNRNTDRAFAKRNWESANLPKATEDDWRELCVAHPEYKDDIYEYFGFNNEVKK